MLRIIRCLLPAGLALLLAAGCGSEPPKPAPGGGKQVSVLATVLPVYVLALGVAGEGPGVKLAMLIPANAGCPHDYALSPGQIQALYRADLLLINGAGLEEFLVSGPAARVRGRLKIADLSAGLDLLREEVSPGGTKPAEDGHVHAGEYNPHTWASPRNAARMTLKIGEELSGVDPADAERYRRNAAEQARELDALAAEFAAAAKTFPNRKIVTVHEIFDYLARDCGLAVVGEIEESPGQAPGLGVFAELVRKVRAEKPAAIFYEPQYSAKPAQALGRETGVSVHALDPFATGRPERGEYLRVMRRNLETLKSALGAPAPGG